MSIALLPVRIREPLKTGTGFLEPTGSIGWGVFTVNELFSAVVFFIKAHCEFFMLFILRWRGIIYECRTCLAGNGWSASA
jgi:hypothetical protein